MHSDGTDLPVTKKKKVNRAICFPDLMNLSSRGVSSRLRGSTLSGNWAMERHSRLRKLGKSVLSLGSEANFSCSRKSTPTSPLSMTSQPGSPLTPDSSSSSSCNSFSMTSREEDLLYSHLHIFTSRSIRLLLNNYSVSRSTKAAGPRM